MSNICAKTDRAVARGLGLASIAIGLSEIAAPRLVERLLGIEDNQQTRGVLRALGVRELGHGVDILANGSASSLAGSLWGRVGGDVLDTAMLGVAASKTDRPARFAAVSASVLAIGLLDFAFAARLSRRRD